MNRRRFIRSQPLGVAQAIVPEPKPLPGDLTLLRVTRRAMATTFEIAIPYGTPHALDAATDALDLIDELEDQLSVYRDHSEVSRLNAVAASQPVVVEDRIFDLLAHATTHTRDTGGAFDIASGALIKAWGFHRRQGRIPTAAEHQTAMQMTGMRHVILDSERRTVKFRRAGLELNLGAIGKGYALDRAAELLRNRWGIASALLHGGGSSVRAIGIPPGQPRGWAVVVKHPWDESQNLGTVWLVDQGFGTSAATFQYFEYKGKKYGHVLDPRTGWPTEGVASASVIAPNAAEADAISTAFFVLGPEPATQYCRPRPELSAIMLPDSATIPPEVIVIGLDSKL